MDQKKPILFSIGSYHGDSEPTVRKVVRTGPFSVLDRSRPASLDISRQSPVQHNTLPRSHKVQDLHNGAPDKPDGRSVLPAPVLEKPTCPPSTNGAACEYVKLNGNDKPANPPKMINRSVSLEPDQGKLTGRVALTIAAYEKEPRTPTRLDFLPPSPRSVASAASSVASTPVEDAEPIACRLQNELVATLKRSNLKKRSEPSPNDKDQDNVNAVNTECEPEPDYDETNEKPQNGITRDFQSPSEPRSEPRVKFQTELPNGNVKKLASVLNKNLVFKFNSENTEDDKKV